MKELRVEVADTCPKRERGLMGIKKLAKDSGMLFKFPYFHRLAFWMKNTYVPLDIAFLDDDGVVMQIEEMTPLSTRAIVADRPCKIALEVNQGWFKENGIEKGSLICGEGITHKRGISLNKSAQMTPAPVFNAPPLDPTEAIPEMTPPETQLPGETVREQRDPDVKLNITIRELIEDADYRGLALSIVYRIKDRPSKPPLTLPPKKISGPFTFEPDEFGDEDAIVKCWDEQEAQWKSFLISNIMSLDYFDPENVENIKG